MQRVTGTYQTAHLFEEDVRAYIPYPLPPDPALKETPQLRALLDEAHLALGRLDSSALFLPDISLFLYLYVRKEAVLSSQIEGTQSSLSDLLLFELEETPGVPLDDVQEVSCYVNALQHGMARLNDGFPLSLRLICEIHAKLLASGRGKEKEPGEFRRTQNWIGGSRPGNAAFVPPPVNELMQCLGALEKFLHDDPPGTPPFLRAAYAHVQFETIHPFLDGNGRVGRLLITLAFCAWGILKQPILYPSLYFKTHRDRYYELLQRVRTEGDWESWVLFFAEAIRDTAINAVTNARALSDLIVRDRQRVLDTGRQGPVLHSILTQLSEQPILSIKKIAEKTKLAPNTIAKAFEKLHELKIADELTGKRRNRLFIYRGYFDILEKGVQP